MLLRVIVLCLIAGQSLAFNLKETDSPYGVWGRSPALMAHLGYQEVYLEDFLEQGGLPGNKPIPKTIKGSPTSHSGKSLLTLNQMGFDIVTGNQTNWVIHDFLTQIKRTPHPTVLDVGGGYGGLTKKALKAGATVVYNDLLAEHLLAGVNSFSFQFFKNVYLNNFRFPQETAFPDESFDAVMLHRVVVLLTPEEMDAGLSKIKRWLKPNGKIYIVSLTPEHSAINPQFLTEHETRRRAGNLWPGYPLDVNAYLPSQAYGLPKTIHAMDGQTLTDALERHGFKVEQKGYVSLKHLNSEDDQKARDGREHYGIVGAMPLLIP